MFEWFFETINEKDSEYENRTPQEQRYSDDDDTDEEGGGFFRWFFGGSNESDARAYKKLFGDENVYNDGIVDPRTGKQLPRKFVGSMAYRSGSRVENTCGGDDWEEDRSYSMSDVKKERARYYRNAMDRKRRGEVRHDLPLREMP